MLFLFLADAVLTPEVQELVTKAADSSFKTWVTVLFGILVTSGSFVFKWLFSQLTEQRAMNQATINMLLEYMGKDREKMLTILVQVGDNLDKFAIAVDKIAINTSHDHH